MHDTRGAVPALPPSRRRGPSLEHRLLTLALTLIATLWAGTSLADLSDRQSDVIPINNWPLVHFDAYNTDGAPYPGPDDMAFGFHRFHRETINAEPTVGPNGTLFLSVGGFEWDKECHLYALDAKTGAPKWCSRELNGQVIISSITHDVEGNIYIGDDVSMFSFTEDGRLRWELPVEGFPVSAQFTPDEGHLMFITHIGRIYVVDRETGRLVLPVYETVPGAQDTAQFDSEKCFVGWPEECISANTPAMRADGTFYFTISYPGENDFNMKAMRYYPEPNPRIEPLWESRNLEGGSASSPAISADGSRLYVADLVNGFHALDADTGDIIWSYDLGYTPLGSPSVSVTGVIVPGGGQGGSFGQEPDDDTVPSHTVGLCDLGDEPGLLFDLPVRNVGVPVQAGNRLYVVEMGLVVIDTDRGEVIDRVHQPTGPTIGSTLSSDGWFYTCGWRSGLWGFKPNGSWSPSDSDWSLETSTHCRERFGLPAP